LFSCFYSSAQVPDDARRLFDAASRSAGLTADPLERLRDVRGPAIALALSREWRITDLEARLSARAIAGPRTSRSLSSGSAVSPADPLAASNSRRASSGTCADE
jgi:hypothetical protein